MMGSPKVELPMAGLKYGVQKLTGPTQSDGAATAVLVSARRASLLMTCTSWVSAWISS